MTFSINRPSARSMTSACVHVKSRTVFLPCRCSNVTRIANGRGGVDRRRRSLSLSRTCVARRSANTFFVRFCGVFVTRDAGRDSATTTFRHPTRHISRPFVRIVFTSRNVEGVVGNRVCLLAYDFRS